MPSYSLRELPESERPRERLRKHGVEALTDAELLALVIRSGGGNGNVLEVSRQVLARFGLDTLRSSSLNEMKTFDGIGEVKAGQLLAVGELGRRIASYGREKTETVRSFEDAVPHLEEMNRFDTERVGMICLDPANTVLATVHELLRGSVDRVNVETRVIVREAVRQQASGIILAHNHPSGDPEPSEKDIAVTRDVEQALDTVGVSLLDHVVVGDECRSIKKEGYL